ncbi:unnamed protein product [Rangifer tarandus platyrhynchus]|uniref:Uncharacterized protein n=2 Tax=Rangifer tarandus platyrhynchus TaxID=3082113 RepID=A0AC59ZDH2_RANTA|nr:unnamed protein product [Rangifer tarandus platyrhynchus]
MGPLDCEAGMGGETLLRAPVQPALSPTRSLQCYIPKPSLCPLKGANIKKKGRGRNSTIASEVRGVRLKPLPTRLTGAKQRIHMFFETLTTFLKFWGQLPFSMSCSL